MKLIAILILFTIVGCKAEGTNGISSKIFERDRGKDGKTRIETVSRNKTVILRIHSTIRGGITNIVRSHFAGGELVMTETDDTADGFFERVTVYNPAGKNEMEVFDRRLDGSVQPVSSEVLAGYKQQHAAISKFFEDLEKDKDVDKAMEKLEALQKEIADANKRVTSKK